MLTEKQIEFLNKVCPDRWTETNGVITVKGDVSIYGMNLTKIPVQFGQVNGHFDCQFNKLTNLYGCPSIITWFFNCDSNQLTSLEGGPKEVGEWYSCENNLLTNLIGAPEVCNGHFWCKQNLLTSLEGCPKLIKGDLLCGNYGLYCLYHIGYVKGFIDHYFNNNLNKWIIKHTRSDNIFKSIEDIKIYIEADRYMLLKTAPNEIRKLFSKYKLHYADNLC